MTAVCVRAARQLVAGEIYHVAIHAAKVAVATEPSDLALYDTLAFRLLNESADQL